MTNTMIILMESIKLMESGVIKGTGQKFKTDDGKVYEMPEPIHTFQKWKSLGYKVKAGSKCIAQFPIWSYTKKKNKDMSEEEAQEKGYCYMKTASFFKSDQVEKMEEKA